MLRADETGHMEHVAGAMRAERVAVPYGALVVHTERTRQGSTIYSLRGDLIQLEASRVIRTVVCTLYSLLSAYVAFPVWAEGVKSVTGTLSVGTDALTACATLSACHVR